MSDKVWIEVYADDVHEIVNSTIHDGVVLMRFPEWQDISTAPDLERVFVAGWQKPSGNVAGYWWFYEDMTDVNCIPIDHPMALKWRPLPLPPIGPPLSPS